MNIMDDDIIKTVADIVTQLLRITTNAGAEGRTALVVQMRAQMRSFDERLASLEERSRAFDAAEADVYEKARGSK